MMYNKLFKQEVFINTVSKINTTHHPLSFILYRAPHLSQAHAPSPISLDYATFPSDLFLFSWVFDLFTFRHDPANLCSTIACTSDHQLLFLLSLLSLTSGFKTSGNRGRVGR